MGVLDNNYDVIIICETWLTKCFNSEEYFPSDYVVHRKDRYYYDTSLKGGGVLIAVQCLIPNEMIACHLIHDVIAVRVKVANSSVLVVAVYIPCGSNLDYYIDIINFIDSAVSLAQTDEQIMIIGDFNLPNMSWFDVNGVFTSSSTDENAIAIIYYCASIATTQINRISNGLGKFLDLLFSTDVMY